MKLSHRWLLAAVAVVIALPVTAGAQQGAARRDSVRQRQLDAAQRQVEEAQKQLQRALHELQAAQSEQANDALREAMAAAREAQRNLRLQSAQELLGRVWTTETPQPFSGAVIAFSSRPRMGVLLSSNTDNDSLGVELEAVSPGQPADDAGLKAGDVITAVNGKSLARTSRRDASPGSKLTDMLGDMDAGDTVTVAYRRGDAARTTKVVLRNLDSSAYSYFINGDSIRMRVDSMVRARVAPTMRVEVPSEPMRRLAQTIELRLPYSWLDMELTDLNPDLGAYFGTSKGVLVVRGPRSADLGLKSGDVILDIDGREPTSPAHALRIMRSYDPGETMKIDIMRNKRQETITVKVPERSGGFGWDSGPGLFR
jgi:S1-C subfamily serine protease